jgi:hypothetical protein
MRYEKFLLEPNEVPTPPKGEGLIVIKTGISELDACENRNQNKLFEAIFCMITELFELRDLEMHTTNYSNSFFLITNYETAFNDQKGILSPELSREKLKKAEAKEIAGAIIDLIRNRDKWDQEKYYRSIESSNI